MGVDEMLIHCQDTRSIRCCTLKLVCMNFIRKKENQLLQLFITFLTTNKFLSHYLFSIFSPLFSEDYNFRVSLKLKENKKALQRES